MSDSIRAALERLVELDGLPDSWSPAGIQAWDDAIAAGKAALAEERGEGLSNRIASIAKAVQECAFTWEPDARLVGNVCAEDIADLCSAVLARWGHQPTPPAEGEVAELAEFLRIYGDEVMDEYGDVGEHDQLTRAADLLEQRHPAPVPVPVSERLPGPGEMDGSLVWCGSQAAGLSYWEWCLDDIRHPCSSGYTHWLPANTPALPTALPQGEVE